jgi:hypothetical protein
MGIGHLGLIAGWTSLALIVYGFWYFFRKSRTITV